VFLPLALSIFSWTIGSPTAQKPQGNANDPEAQFPKKIIDSVRGMGGAATRSFNFSGGHFWWDLDFSLTKARSQEIRPIVETILEEEKTRGFVPGLTTIHSLTLRKTDIGDEIVGALDPCRPITDATGKFGFGGLFGLNLSHAGLTRKGINQILATHIRLNRLDLSGLPVDSRCLVNIHKMQNLGTLILRNTPLNDAAALQLADVTLDKLDLADSSISNDFIKILGVIPKVDQHSRPKLSATLTEIDLSGTRITDEALEHLQSFGKLQRVDLSRTSISDERRIEMLVTKLKALEEIKMFDTALAEEAVPRLSKSWPKIRFVK